MNQSTQPANFANPANSPSGAQRGSQPQFPVAPKVGLPTRQQITQADIGTVPAEGTSHLTKTGTPDRRFKGQRDLPDQVLNPNYRSPTKSMQLDADGHLLTKDGKPDRRYKGAREMSDKEVAIAQAKWTLEQEGIKVK